MNKGTDQKSRVRPALNPDHVPMDERTMLDMVKSTLDLAQHVKFYGLDNRVEGNWRKVFLSDPVFIISLMATWDVKKFRVKHDRILDEATAKLTEENILSTLDNMLDMIGQVSEWYLSLRNAAYKGSLNKELKQILSSSDKELKKIGHWVRNIKGSSNKEQWIRINSKLGQLETDLDEIDARETESEKDIPDVPDMDLLSSSLVRLYRDMVFLKEKAASKFNEELSGKNIHPAHTGLLLSFFKLFKHLQNDLNTLTYKHLKYYYENLLHLNAKSKNVLTALVGLQLQPGKDSLKISPDDSFDFVLADKKELPFHSTEEITINSAVITDIKTLYRSLYLPLRSEQLARDIDLSRFYQTTILEEGENYWNEEVSDFDMLPGTLGENLNPGLNDQRLLESELGLLICSPALILESGKQSIDIKFKLSEESFRITEDKIRRLPDRLPSDKDKESKDKPLDPDVKMAKILNNTFLVSISAREGWKRIEQVQSTLDPEKVSLSFKLLLKPGEEEFIPIDPEIHEGGYSAEWPCIKIMLNNDNLHHPYNLLSEVIIDNISIESCVEEVTNLTLSNSLGNLDPSIPFTPFGPTPTKGSFLRIENPFIFQKNLSSLKIRLDWTALPQQRNGFKSYYEGYPGTIDNNSFKATLSLERNLIRKSDQQDLQTFPLFGSIGATERIDGDMSIDVNLGGKKFSNPLVWPEEESEVKNNALYLLLSEPDMAFGHQIYPNLYSEAVLKGSGLFRKKVNIPQQPYTPMLEEVSLSYTNFVKETILRKQDEKSISIKLVHLYPFGHVQVFPGFIKGPCKLLPQIEHKGHLFLGLEQVVPRHEISIGFDLIPAMWPHTIIARPKIKWEYLVGDYWRPLYYYVLEDSTEGLLHSGIVKIQVPDIISLTHTRMPDGKFWIRAVSEGEGDLNSRIISVFTQAVHLKASDDALSDLADKQKLEEVERISFQSKPGIQTIHGPVNIKWEATEETEKSRFTRISERLRHKNRAVTHWDFEHLILDRFPEVERVRVYGRNSHPKELVKNSSVQVVVVPRYNPFERIQLRRKEVPCHILLGIKSFLKSYISPYARVEVANPVYEELKVKCKVRFKDQQKSGHYRSRLNEELIQCLSPGHKDSVIPEGFDPSVSKTEILNFIEEREYVDFVTEFSILQVVEVENNYKIIDTADRSKIGILRTISGYALLTSAPKHLIEIISDDDYLNPDKSTIGDLFIESDFIISDKDGKYH